MERELGFEGLLKGHLQKSFTKAVAGSMRQDIGASMIIGALIRFSVIRPLDPTEL
jgi:hypothetical protein